MVRKVVVAALLAGASGGVVAGMWLRPTAVAQPAPGAAAAGPKYTVVDTEGTNLLVVDNSTNVLHFYTIDPGQEVGADLHLRGSLDLNEVGRPTIKPKKAAK